MADSNQHTGKGLPTEYSRATRRPRTPQWISIAWPWVIWLLVCGTAYILYTKSMVFGGLTGTVETVAEPIASLETARLLEIHVATGDKVSKGDLVATLDTSLLDSRMALDEARMLEAESTITGYQQNILQLVRQFETAIRDAEAELALEKLRQNSDRAELDELEKELNRREQLLARQLISEEELSQLRPRVAALRRSMESYPAIISALETRLDDARTQREEINRWLRVDGEDDISEAILKKMEARNAIITASQEQAELRRSFYQLRATRDGVVSRIFHQPGDVVSAGDPIVRLVQERSSRIIGFLPENFVSDVLLGQRVNVYRANGRSSTYHAKVTSIGAEVLSLPGRLSPIQASPLRGRRIILELEEETDLIPGETVKIRRIAKWPSR